MLDDHTSHSKSNRRKPKPKTSSVTVKRASNGGFIASCNKESADMVWYPSEDYTFDDVEALSTFLGKELKA